MYDGLRTFGSRAGLITPFAATLCAKETPSDQSSLNTLSATLRVGGLAKYMVFDQANAPPLLYLDVEYIRSKFDNVSDTPDPSGEKLATLPYNSKARGTVVKRAMVAPVEISVLQSPSASYSLR